MKIQHLVLFALAAAFTAGCSPKNGPSGYPEGEGPGGPIVTGPGAGPEVGQGAGGELFPKPSTGLDGWNGDLSKLNPEAIVLVVHFGFDKYTVEAGERAKIDSAAASLKGSGATIIAAGYSDHFGTEDYNLGLSDKRANSVKSYLGKTGVTNTDIRAFGEQFANQSGDKNSVAEDRKVVIIDTSKIK
jgi:outer membrane protein OmpA-like peptidoglycan-associated protein